MVAHQKPGLKVLEVNLSSGDSFSIWFDRDGSNDSLRTIFRQYGFAAKDANTLMEEQEKYGSQRSTAFSPLDLSKAPGDMVKTEADFDLAIVKLVRSITQGAFVSVAL